MNVSTYGGFIQDLRAAELRSGDGGNGGRGGDIASHNTSIYGPQIVVNPSKKTNEQEKVLEVLRQRIAAGAFHNSAERYDPPKCHPHTRKTILQEIMDWTKEDPNVHPILWIYGPAGSGKSSIAQTMAELLEKAGKSAASFFFSRTAASRNDDSHLVATIAYQLALSMPTVSEHILQKLSRDPAVFDKLLEVQMNDLVVEPLSNVAENDTVDNESRPTDRRILIIDGLDECDDPKCQRRILTVLFSAIQNCRTPLFVLIASRPEYEIRNFLNLETVHPFARRLVLDDTYNPDEDIAVVLRSSFDDMRRFHPSGPHLPSFGSDSDIKRLVQKASGQFIYVSTVVKYIGSPDHWPPDRLGTIFGLPSNAPATNTPFAELDTLYAHILSSAASPMRVLEIFIFLLFQITGSNLTAQVQIVEYFLGFRYGELHTTLKDLHSIIDIPNTTERHRSLRLFHASLGDFLLDRNRAGSFFIDTGKGHAQMARYLVKCLDRTTFSSGGHVFEIARRGFVQHCVKSYPTHGLVEALRGFNFRTYLRYPFSEGNSEVQAEALSSLPAFFEWLFGQAQIPSASANDLYHLYLEYFDHFLKLWLSKCYPSESDLITASTLDGFDRYAEDIFEVLCFEKSRESSGFCLSRAKDLKLRKYYSMTTQFLLDQDRSGVYHVSNSRYKSLVHFLIDRAVKEQPHRNSRQWHKVQKVTLTLLPVILSVVSPDPELAKYLRYNPIPEVRDTTPLTDGNTLRGQWKTAQDAIQLYINVEFGIPIFYRLADIELHVRNARATIW